jgi:hypothetical protein
MSSRNPRHRQRESDEKGGVIKVMKLTCMGLHAQNVFFVIGRIESVN